MEFAWGASWVMLLKPGKAVRSASALLPQATHRFDNAAAGTGVPLPSVPEVGKPRALVVKLAQSAATIGVPAGYGLLPAGTGKSWLESLTRVKCVPLLPT